MSAVDFSAYYKDHFMKIINIKDTDTLEKILQSIMSIDRLYLLGHKLSLTNPNSSSSMLIENRSQIIERIFNDYQRKYKETLNQLPAEIHAGIQGVEHLLNSCLIKKYIRIMYR